MAMTGAVWGIDIGQCALKALRCYAHDDDDGMIVADAFDYIEYPKILSQAGADPGELVADALKQFLSRNAVQGDRVAISVAGQSGLARFIKLPPVEAKKIPDIVKYEARQQIPFDLNDVIWDYQRMGGGSEEEGFALETEIGLFAMKRDVVFRALEPFQKAGIEIDFVQLTPLSLYNFVLFDQLRDLPPADEYNPENPPESVVILSLGTDATDLVVTNGYRVWQRSVPLGGNHFTKALTKEMKLTFAKAEHLKRNATTAQDPKAVFQAMRPVFSDLLTEVQRSIGYFMSIDRSAKISHIVALGNAMKLPGLRRYLSQSLGFDIVRLEEFRGLTGFQVLSAPAFRSNSLCFGVCYGLALQGLGKSGLQTNLLPGEIVKDRMIRQKKPWAVAAAAILMLGVGIGFSAAAIDKKKVSEGRWGPAEQAADRVTGLASRFVSETEEKRSEFNGIKQIGDTLVRNVEGRILWLELLHTLNQCLPSSTPAAPARAAAGDGTDVAPDGNGNGAEDPYQTPIPDRDELHVTSLECRYLKDVSVWYKQVEQWYEPPKDAEPEPEPDPDDTDAKSAKKGPKGPGWIVMVTGYHYHNYKDAGRLQGARYVRETLIKNLHERTVTLPKSDREEAMTVSTGELGISYPVLVDPRGARRVQIVNPNTVSEDKRAGDAGGGESEELRRFDFLVHFCWQPTTPSDREKEREAEEKEGRAAAEAAAEDAEDVEVD